MVPGAQWILVSQQLRRCDVMDDKAFRGILGFPLFCDAPPVTDDMLQKWREEAPQYLKLDSERDWELSHHAGGREAVTNDQAGVKAPAAVRRWRHVKRGTVYTEIGRAELQVAKIAPDEGCTLVIYRGDDGKLWAREDSEFEDGRFEEVQPALAE